jgi:hypothetical protein
MIQSMAMARRLIGIGETLLMSIIVPPLKIEEEHQSN